MEANDPMQISILIFSGYKNDIYKLKCSLWKIVTNRTLSSISISLLVLAILEQFSRQHVQRISQFTER